MILCNCSKYELNNRIRSKRIILFGCGKVLRDALEKNHAWIPTENISYLIDNRFEGQICTISGKSYEVYSPVKLCGEKSCVVIIMSSKYYQEMYEQLVGLNLSDDVECYLYPMIRVSNFTHVSEENHSKVLQGKYQIPKLIHSFWFSGEKKPDSYQKCIDSWEKYCPEYTIKEWTLSNYDIEKNDFMKMAAQQRKWAFVADFARLDVVNTYGGVYMDMDVELLKRPQELFCHKSIFSFNMSDHIDLAMFASVSNNPILEELMKLYEGKVFNSDGKTMNSFSQPGFVEEYFTRVGILMNGKLQWKQDMVFLPKTYLMPLDMFTYLPVASSKYTYAIHWCNGGWREEKSTPKQVKKNRKLWELFNSRGK